MSRIMTGYPSIDKPWLKYYTQDQIDVGLPKCRIYDCVWNANKDNQDRVALNYFDRKITYRQMFDEIEKTARAFLQIGVNPGDIVTLIVVTLPETIYTFYALNRIGAISNMIDPRTSTEGISSYVNEVHSDIVVTIDAVYDKVMEAISATSAKRVIVLSPADSLLFPKKQLYKAFKTPRIKSESRYEKWSDFIRSGQGQTVNDRPYREDECCVIVHTGGTTGMPKGVMLSNDNLNASAQQILQSPLPLTSGDAFLNIMPPFIAYGTVLGIHTVAVGGLYSILIPLFKADQFDQLIIKYKPQCLMGVPAYFEVIMNSQMLNSMDLSFIKVAFVGGDGIKEETEKRINSFFQEHNCNIKISKGYSLTEASATATFASERCNKLGSVGSPLAKTVVSCFDDSFEVEKKYGEIGNVFIQSPTIMRGYYGNDEETNKMIRFDRTGNKWLYTGDLGYVDEDGQIFIEGRKKRMIVRHDGFKVYPNQIETVLQKNPYVHSCCAVGKDDDTHSQGRLPVVFVVIKENNDITKSDICTQLLELCVKELPEYAQPKEIYFIDEMPLTPIGKVDYRALESNIVSRNHLFK